MEKGGIFLIKSSRAPLLLIFVVVGTLILSAEASKLQLKTTNFPKENRLSLQDLLSESGITHFLS